MMGLVGRDGTPSEVERTVRNIIKRCVQCPTTAPSCPKCGKGEICSLVPQTCDSCAHSVCIRNPSPSVSPSGPNVGAIAGGVIGGVAFVAIIVFFVWRFWIKKKREQQELEAEGWEEDEVAQQKATHQFNAMRSDAASTRTRGSLANSILSRASNIIQIAYIPGVTNRNGSGHNSLLGGPVPPIPAQTRGSRTPKSPLSNEGDALFFRPGDLRDSTWSASSSMLSGNRDTQYMRQSITPSLARSSMASELYRDDATEVPMPAQTVMRAAPRMVSVKSTSSASPSESSGSKTPGSDAQTPNLSCPQVLVPGQSSSTAASPAGSLRGKAKQITVGSKGRFPVRQVSDASTTASTLSAHAHAPVVSSPLAEVDTSDDEEDHARARQSLLDASTYEAPLIQPVESPFFDASEQPQAAKPNPYASMASTVKRAGNGGSTLPDIIEEATKRASKMPSHGGLGGKGDMSPFADEHATE